MHSFNAVSLRTHAGQHERNGRSAARRPLLACTSGSCHSSVRIGPHRTPTVAAPFVVRCCTPPHAWLCTSGASHSSVRTGPHITCTTCAYSRVLHIRTRMNPVPFHLAATVYYTLPEPLVNARADALPTHQPTSASSFSPPLSRSSTSSFFTRDDLLSLSWLRRSLSSPTSIH